MRPIKMFGLASLVALMAMAFMGANSAMAEETTLCSEVFDEECGSAVTHVHETTLEGNKAVLKTSILTIECDVLFLGDTLGESGAPLVIHGNFTYTNCSSNCKATEENGPAEIKVLKEGHETAAVTGEGLVHVECSGLNCRYNGVGLKGTAKGPLLSSEDHGEVSLKEQTTNKESGLFCPSTSTLTITTTPLSEVFLGGAEHVCIFVGSNKGLYLGATGTTCTGKKETRIGSYELGAAWTKTAKTHVCAWVGPNNGFYLEAINGGECKTPAHATAIGEFALGVVQ